MNKNGRQPLIRLLVTACNSTQDELTSQIDTYTLAKLQKRLEREIAAIGTQQKLAQKYNVCSAHITNVLNGRESPTLRRAMTAPKYAPRRRLCIDTDGETIDRFDRLRFHYGISRAEFLNELLANHEE